MSSTQTRTPAWVAQLASPPPARSKVNGIVDPPGFSGVPGSKVQHVCLQDDL